MSKSSRRQTCSRWPPARTRRSAPTVKIRPPFGTKTTVTPSSPATGAAPVARLTLSPNGVVVICEVKTRTSDRFGSPAEAVTIAKQRRIRRLAAEFLASADLPRGEIRFDVAAILGQTIEVIEAAF
jgi:Uncharacterised protein family UPF0102